MANSTLIINRMDKIIILSFFKINHEFQSVSCEKKFAHAHVRAHSQVCDVRAMFVRAALLLGVPCAIAHLHIFATFRTFLSTFCDTLRIFKVFSSLITFF